MAQQRPNLAQKNAKKVPGWFSFLWVPKLFPPLVKIRIFGPKTTRSGPKYAFLVILGQILVLLIHLVPCLTKITMRTRFLGGFLICWYQNFFSLPKKTAIFAQKYAFFGTYRTCRLIWCPVGWCLWCAGCISQDTYLLYDNSMLFYTLMSP